MPLRNVVPQAEQPSAGECPQGTDSRYAARVNNAATVAPTAAHATTVAFKTTTAAQSAAGCAGGVAQPGHPVSWTASVAFHAYASCVAGVVDDDCRGVNAAAVLKLLPGRLCDTPERWVRQHSTTPDNR